MFIKTNYLRGLMYLIAVCLIANAILITYCFVYYPDKHIYGLNAVGIILLIPFFCIQSIIKKRATEESTIDNDN